LRLVTWIFQPLARSKQLSLIVDAPVAGLVAMCDDVRIQRVLETLLTHAVNFSPPESKILLSARLEGDWLRFSVTDEGPGISPDELEAAFEANDNPLVRFVAEDAGVDNEMAACHRIVTAHGGKIKTSNLPEGGTLFEFAIPAAMSHRAGQSSNVA
jgi:signal transduction histidine kinase